MPSSPPPQVFWICMERKTVTRYSRLTLSLVMLRYKIVTNQFTDMKFTTEAILRTTAVALQILVRNKSTSSTFQYYAILVSCHPFQFQQETATHYQTAFSPICGLVTCNYLTQQLQDNPQIRASNHIAVNIKHRRNNKILTMLPGVPSQDLCLLRRFSHLLSPSPQHILHRTHSLCFQSEKEVKQMKCL